MYIDNINFLLPSEFKDQIRWNPQPNIWSQKRRTRIQELFYERKTTNLGVTFFAEKIGTLYKADPDPNPDFQKKRTPEKNGSYTKIHFMRQRLMFDKFEGADLKYDNGFLKARAQTYLNKAFLVPDLGIFIFSRNFAFRQIWGCWFQTWQ